MINFEWKVQRQLKRKVYLLQFDGEVEVQYSKHAMCYHTSQHKNIKEIKSAFGLPVKNEELFQQAYQPNGFAKPYLPVISTSDSIAIDMFGWGLIPFCVKDERTFKANTLNARSKELFEKTSYKNLPLSRRI